MASSDGSRFGTDCQLASKKRHHYALDLGKRGLAGDPLKVEEVQPARPDPVGATTSRLQRRKSAGLPRTLFEKPRKSMGE
jgi:hypothetical protein